MDIQQKNFFNLTAAYAVGSKAELDSPNWEEIYRLSHINNVEGMIYSVVKKEGLCADEKALADMRKAAVAAVANSTRKEFALSNMIKLLNLNEIRHIIFKGAVVRDYYPNKELRTMGDIDIAIDESDKKRVHSSLIEAGAVFDEVHSHADVLDYTLNGTLFEIHTKIVTKNVFEDVDYTDYFAEPFSHAKLREAYTYEFEEEFHLIYLLVHMAKHFKFGGCGVRMYLDIVMLLRHFGEKLDWDYIKKELKCLKLVKFADSVFQFCNTRIGTDIALIEGCTEETMIDAIGDYVVSGGTFGYNDKNIDAIRAGNTGGFGSKIKTVCYFLFPSHERLKRRYEWMEHMKKWMLPISWVRYWFYRLFTLKEDSVARVRKATEGSDDAARHLQMMRMIGLEEEK